MSLACCNRLAAPSSPRICIASSDPAKPIVSSISAMFCSATDTSCFVSSSCLGVPSALIQDWANSFTVGVLFGASNKACTSCDNLLDITSKY